MTTRAPPTLPPECIRLVLEHLVLDGSFTTLASMLLISKCMYYEVIPVLYRDPFQSFRQYGAKSWDPFLKLVRLLTTSRSISPTPRVQFITNALLGAVPQDVSSSSFLHEQTPLEGRSPWNLSSFVRQLEFDRSPLVSVLATLHCSSPSQFNELRADNYTASDLRMEVTRILVDGLAEQLQSIAIPLWDIGWYQSRINRFQSLRHVIFQEFGDCEMGQSSKDAFKATLGLIPTVPPKQALFGPINVMTVFVKEHTKMFKGVLKNVECVNLRTGVKIVRVCPDIRLIELAALLPPPENPRHLDEFSIFNFLAHADEINLDSLETISAFLKPELEVIHMAQIFGRILYKCQRLRRLSWRAISPDLLCESMLDHDKWAMPVDDNGSASGDAIGSLSFPDSTKQPRTSGRYTPRIVAPLETIEYFSPILTHSHIIDNILSYFCSSLRRLRVVFDVTLATYVNPQGMLRSYVIIGGDTLPSFRRLQYLSVETSVGMCVWLRPAALGESPLVKLEIDNHVSWTAESIAYTSASWVAPLQASQLTVLHLQGPSSVTFHPATFLTSKDLESVILSVGSWTHSYITSNKPLPGLLLEQQQVLKSASWDWHLPRLTSLSLSDAFATFFQFRMLETCPALQYLYLNLPSKRHLTSHELQKPRTDLSRDGNQDAITQASGKQTSLFSSSKDYISAPALRFLSMDGPWTIPIESWKVLVKSVVPNIKDLRVPQSSGFDLRVWVEEIQSMPRLEDVWTSFKDFKDDEVELLSRVNGGPDSELPAEDYISISFESGTAYLKRRARLSDLE